MQDRIRLNLEAPPAITSLRELAKAEEACRRCPLYRDTTQAVPGEGGQHAHLMLVGEQPGDKEDIAGKPFVGPAGRMLDQALAQAGIPRSEVFVTNAVKHFKHEMRGKRRLHKRPSSSEIERCRIWLDVERAIIKPAAVVALGATAAFVTIHPSFLLRIEDHADKEREYRRFISDLALAAKMLAR